MKDMVMHNRYEEYKCKSILAVVPKNLVRDIPSDRRSGENKMILNDEPVTVSGPLCKYLTRHSLGMVVIVKEVKAYDDGVIIEALRSGMSGKKIHETHGFGATVKELNHHIRENGLREKAAQDEEEEVET